MNITIIYATLLVLFLKHDIKFCTLSTYTITIIAIILLIFQNYYKYIVYWGDPTLMNI